MAVGLSTVVAVAVVGGVISVWPSHQAATTTPIVAASSPPSTVPASSSPSTARTDSTLPRSAALTPTQMVVPMSLDDGKHFHLFLGDTASPAARRQLTKGKDSEFNVVVSPDRRSVIFIRTFRDPRKDKQRAMEVMASDGSHPRKLFAATPDACSGKAVRPAWDPVDQTLLAMPCVARNGDSTLRLIHTDGKQVRTLDIGNPPGVAWKVGDPTFSPDGKRLAFWAGPNADGGALYISDLSKADGPKRLTSANSPGRDSYPTWAPDGKSLIFDRRIADRSGSGNLDIYRVSTGGSRAAVPLITGPGDDQTPSWSPSGDQVAYKTDAPSSAWPGSPVLRVWIADSRGGHPHPLWVNGTTGLQGTSSWTSR